MLLEVGMAASGGMGPAPITWAEIGQWQRLTAQPLQPWEARSIRQASVEYVSELAKAADPACPPPWAADPTEEDRRRVADGLREAMSRGRKG